MFNLGYTMDCKITYYFIIHGYTKQRVIFETLILKKRYRPNSYNRPGTMKREFLFKTLTKNDTANSKKVVLQKS
jgi:hypothetical protein